jgi:hypothetical protein
MNQPVTVRRKIEGGNEENKDVKERSNSLLNPCQTPFTLIVTIPS